MGKNLGVTPDVLKRISTAMTITGILLPLAIIAISILLLSIIYSISYDYNLPQIAPLDFDKNNWIITDNNDIIDDSSNQKYAIVGDQLIYRANFTNISKSNIFVIPEVQIHFNDSPPTKLTYDPIYFIPNQKIPRSFNFSLIHEGANQVLVLFDVHDWKTGNHTGGIRASSTITTISFNNKLQHDSNSISLKNTIISSGIGTITTVALIVSYLSSRDQTNTAKKQLRNYELELKNRMRPWVSPISLEAVYMEFPNSDSGTVTYDEGVDLIKQKIENESDAIVTFYIKIKNTGSIPALNILYRHTIHTEKITKESLMALTPMKKISLVPEELDKISFQVPLRQCDEGFYVGLSVEYTVRKSRETAGKIWQITYNDENAVDSWIDTES